MRQFIIGFGLISFGVVATPADAAHHRATRAHHAKSATHVPKESREKKAVRDAKAPGGATSVPAAGIKLYCAPRKSPLMVRKMTQGAGTTVTVICR